MESEIAISFRFVGGDADEHQLNFYDASRFMYGASRFIYTLEHFRQTGRVLGKITERVNVDYRVATPQPSSWLLDVLAIAAPAINEAAIKVPIDVLVGWVKEKLLPAKDSAAKGIQLVREIEGEKTKQSEEETKRVVAMTDTVNNALAVVEKAIDLSKSTPKPTNQDLIDYQSELLAAQSRAILLNQYNDQLSMITGDQENALLAKAHAQVAEMGKPLFRSAGRLEITAGNERRPLSSMNRRSMASLGGNEEDPLPTQLSGDILRFDKANGWGKFRSPVFKKDVPFVVPAARKNRLRGVVLDAMKVDGVVVSFYMVRDKRRVVKYLVFDDIIDVEVE